jgi:antitoxin CptB
MRRLSVRYMNPTELNRLRWRCRRGMLENDLILTRFLDARGSAMSAEDVVALDRLLDLADGELWDLIAGRAEPSDPGLLSLVAELRLA